MCPDCEENHDDTAACCCTCHVDDIEMGRRIRRLLDNCPPSRLIDTETEGNA